jgi:signal transduction histidine kinase
MTCPLLEDANLTLAAKARSRQSAERTYRGAHKMEAIDRLAAGVAHDVNNLLAVITAGLDLLERTTDPTRRERIVSGMRQAAARGEALTRQLLTSWRRMVLSPQLINLQAVVDEISLLLAGALRGGIAVQMRIPQDLWPVIADPAELEQAIMNMVINAQDAMPNGGILTFDFANVRLDGTDTGKLTGEFVRIEVSDTGTGIPPENLDRVFEPFFTTKDANKGTGLGMGQIYAFAKRSGGHVAITSCLGQGTSIVLHLPRVSDDASEKGRTIHDSAKQPWQNEEQSQWASNSTRADDTGKASEPAC